MLHEYLTYTRTSFFMTKDPNLEPVTPFVGTLDVSTSSDLCPVHKTPLLL